MKEIINWIKKFSRKNWWIYIVFVFCLYFIFTTDSWNIVEILIIFTFHFLWDMFMMMMWDNYANNEKKKGSIYQILGLLVFCIISIYSLIFNWKINYIISQLMFWFTWLKVYFEDIFWKKYKIFSYKTSIILWLIILWNYYYFNLFNTFWEFLQMIWFISFSVFLIINNEKIKYFWSLVAIFLTTFAWWTEIYNSFLISNIKWIDISYTLLPLTVFISYLKNIKLYL